MLLEKPRLAKTTASLEEYQPTVHLLKMRNCFSRSGMCCCKNASGTFALKEAKAATKAPQMRCNVS